MVVANDTVTTKFVQSEKNSNVELRSAGQHVQV